MLKLKNIGIIRKTCGIQRFFSTEISLPKQADVVVVGGGVIGCSILYHLSKRGISAILLEKGKITCGTTWHSNAIVWSLRGNDVDTELLLKTRKLLANLEQETGVNPGWITTGGIFIARTPERMEEYKRFHTLGYLYGLESQLISPIEANKICPILNPQSFYGALWSPSDGFTDPSMYCASLIKGAKLAGAEFFENTPVTNILCEPTSNNEKRVIGVETINGNIQTNMLVNACGVWASTLTRMVGLEIPMITIKHSYLVTGTIPEAKGSPCIRDHDESLCLRSQGDSIILGCYEPNPEILKEPPPNFQFSLFELDMSIFDQHWKQAVNLCPSLEKAGIKSDVCGPESFTPDHKPIVGEDPKCVGLFHATGFNSLGVMMSGGIGEQIALWIALGQPELSLHNYDLRRFTPSQRQDRAWVIETTHEAYAKTYSTTYPHDQPLAGRNHSIDPFHEELVASGAVMEQALGWERPAYFIKERTAPVRVYDWYGSYDHIRNEDQRYEKELEGDLTFDFSKNHDVIKEEAVAARNNVALFDLTCYTKMYLTGPDVEEAANWLFTNDVNKEPGSIIYTCSLNAKGGIEADCTVIPLEANVRTLVGSVLKGKGYYMVAGSKSGYQTQAYFRKELYKKNFKSLVTEVKHEIGILSIQGPKSRELLQSITESPINDEKLPHEMSKLVKINGHTCRICRTSNIGELGFELHIPQTSCVSIFHRIMEAGRGFDLKHAGFRALDSLSCEKGYYLINHDLRIDDNPVEAGLVQFCKKNGQYLGKQTVEKIKQKGTTKRRVFFTLNDPVALYGMETIYRDDRIVGFIRRGDYGFSLDSSIGIGYVKHPDGKMVDSEYLKSGNYMIEVRDKKYPARLFLKSPFDPNNLRVKGHYEHAFQERSRD